MEELAQRPRTSGAWKYFTDKSNYIANCNICKRDYSYKASVSNLTKHYKKHMTKKDGYTSDGSVDDASNHSSDFSKSFNRNVRKIDPLSKSTWQYFEVVDSDQFVASCKICDKEISYETVAQLTEHAREHNADVSDDEEWLEKKEEKNNQKQTHRANISAVWRFMKVINDEEKRAICLICKRELSFMTSTSNLRKHIRRAHSHISIDEDVLENSENKVIISSDGELYEIVTSDGGENDPIRTDEVYLEESIDNHDIKEEIRERLPKRIKLIDKKSLKKKQESKEQIHNSDIGDISANTCDKYSTKNTSREDSLNIFGQYITSLLRQLPENISDQLQNNFVKQIFAAKTVLKTSNSLTLNEKPIPVTINNGSNNGIPEITVHYTSDVAMTENTEPNLNKATSSETL